MSNEQREQELKVHLIPVTNFYLSEPNRIEDLKVLVAKIVLSSSQRGRPSKSQEGEMPHAA